MVLVRLDFLSVNKSSFSKIIKMDHFFPMEVVGRALKNFLNF
jgi:hypothetical protein